MVKHKQFNLLYTHTEIPVGTRVCQNYEMKFPGTNFYFLLIMNVQIIIYVFMGYNIGTICFFLSDKEKIQKEVRQY